MLPCRRSTRRDRRVDREVSPTSRPGTAGVTLVNVCGGIDRNLWSVWDAQRHITLFLMYIQLDDEWPESIFHHVGSQSASYLLSVQCEVLSRVS